MGINVNYAMTFINKSIFFTFCTFLSLLAFGQDSDTDEYYDANFLRYENRVYDPNVKTVQMFRKGWSEAFPVVNLNQNEEKIHITFDDLNDNIRSLGYTFIHCSADWKPSDLMKIEYLDGMEDNTIETYGFSRNLYQPFVKYDLSFPNQDVQFSKSGNYILLIYDQDNNDEPLITWRFFVMENYSSIVTDIHPASQPRYRYSSHEVDFTIRQQNIQLIQPFSTLKVVLTQNQNWSSAITDLVPKFVNGSSLIYDYDEENVFAAGNEFRLIDVRNINYNSISTSHTATINDTLNAFNFPDKSRSSKVYLTTPDINGHFYIKNDDQRFDNDLESEYVKVHLALLYPAKVFKGDIYVFGQFTGWEINDQYKMHWNAKKGAYEASMYIKQGYYNYQYMYVSEAAPKGDVSVIEGSHVQTSNEYSIFVYYTEPGQVYDRLIGYKTEIYPYYEIDK